LLSFTHYDLSDSETPSSRDDPSKEGNYWKKKTPGEKLTELMQRKISQFSIPAILPNQIIPLKIEQIVVI